MNKFIYIIILISLLVSFIFCQAQEEETCDENAEEDCKLVIPTEISEEDKINLESPYTEPLKIYFFSQKSCQYCDKIETQLLNDFKNNAKNLIQLQKFYLEEEEGYLIYSLELNQNIDIEGSPVLIIDKYILSGKQNINENYINYIKLTTQIEPSKRIDLIANLTEKEIKQGREEALKEVMNKNIFVIIAMGLLDGINPCAFATIIFLISYLAYAGKTKKEALLIGVIYTIAVFITYFLAGLLFYTIIDSFTAYSIISFVIKIISMGLVSVLAIFTLIDFIKALKGHFSEMTLMLSGNMKRRIHSIIRNKLKLKGIVVSSIIIGIVVSFFELACTGQVYIPTILLIVNDANVNFGVLTTAILKLAIYNISFIIPLVTIFLITYFGVSSKSLQNVLQKNTALIKFLLLILFVGLFIYMVFSYLVI